MSKPSYKKNAQADTTLAQRDDLISQMKAMGWNRKDMVIADHHGTADAGYLLFHRQIQNPKKPSKDAQFFPISRFGKNPDADQISKTLVLQGFSREKKLGANSPMGGAHSNFAPAPTGAAGEMTVSSFSQILSIREMRSADEGTTATPAEPCVICPSTSRTCRGITSSRGRVVAGPPWRMDAVSDL